MKYFNVYFLDKRVEMIEGETISIAMKNAGFSYKIVNCCIDHWEEATELPKDKKKYFLNNHRIVNPDILKILISGETKITFGTQYIAKYKLVKETGTEVFFIHTIDFDMRIFDTGISYTGKDILDWCEYQVKNNTPFKKVSKEILDRYFSDSVQHSPNLKVFSYVWGDFERPAINLERDLKKSPRKERV